MHGTSQWDLEKTDSFFDENGLLYFFECSSTKVPLAKRQRVEVDAEQEEEELPMERETCSGLTFF